MLYNYTGNLAGEISFIYLTTPPPSHPFEIYNICHVGGMVVIWLCFYNKPNYLIRSVGPKHVHMFLHIQMFYKLNKLHILFFLNLPRIFNRPGVAGAVLQTALSLIH